VVRARSARRTAAAAVLVAGLWGCGHEVTPTQGYESPSDRIPNATDFQVLQRPFGPTQRPAVGLSWQSDPAIFEIVDGFHFFRADLTDSEEPAVFDRLNAEPFLEASDYLDVLVDEGRTYAYQIRSVTPAGVLSLPSPAVSITIDGTPPRPPSGLSAEAVRDTVVDPRTGDEIVIDSIVLSWSPSPDPDVVTYRLHRIMEFAPLVGYVELPFTELSFVDTGVEPAITYRYYLTALDGAGNEGDPGEVVEETIPFP
jgi:hypothetical protein